MKRMLTVLLVLLLAVAVCGSVFAGGKKEEAAAATAKPTIGLAMVDLTNPFFVDMMKGGNIAAEEVGVNVIWKSAEGSVEKEIAIIENFVEQKVGCILIDPLDVESVKPAMKKAFDAGIPLVTMGNFVDTPYGNVSTLYNDFQDYKTLTEMLAYSLNQKGNVVHIFGKKGNFVSDERLRGFTAGIEQFPGIKVLAVQPGEWDPALSQRIMEDWMTTYPKIDGLAVWHDGIMYSAVTALKNAGRLSQMKVISYDGDPESSRMVKAGELVADLLTGARRIGAWNVKVGASLAKGAKLNQKVYLPTKFVILGSTLEQLKKNGFNKEIQWIEPDEAIKIAESAVVDWKY